MSWKPLGRGSPRPLQPVAAGSSGDREEWAPVVLHPASEPFGHLRRLPASSTSAIHALSLACGLGVKRQLHLHVVLAIGGCCERSVALAGRKRAGQDRRDVEAAADQALDRGAERIVKAEGAHEVELLGRDPGERQADLAGRQHAELDDAAARPRAIDAGHQRLRVA